MAKNISVARNYEVNGEQKTQWMNIGKVFEKDGRMFGIINVIPTNWDGRFNIFEEQVKAEETTSATATATKQANKPNDLPF